MKRLSLLILIGIGYTGWLYGRGTLTGAERTDGILGVVLGLYICSHPAATLVEMLFFNRKNDVRFSVIPTLCRLGVNLLVMLIGWMTVFMGTMRLVGRTG